MAKLFGRFEPSGGRPLVSGRILIPRTGEAIDLSFLVDTGAEISVLSADDALPLGLETLAGPTVTIAGSAGVVSHRTEIAILQFLVGKRAFLYRTPIVIISPSPEFRLLPTLIGRDILHRWDMSYRPSRGRLTFDIVTADEVLRLS